MTAHQAALRVHLGEGALPAPQAAGGRPAEAGLLGISFATRPGDIICMRQRIAAVVLTGNVGPLASTGPRPKDPEVMVGVE